MKDLLHWVRTAGGESRAEHAILERNQHISASYARWYLARPDVFKWVGVSAFSSHRIGILLSLFDLTFEAGALRRARLRYPRAAPLLVDADDNEILAGLERLRRANNEIFENMGWAHAAFIDPDGGLAAIESVLANQPEQAALLEGFRLLDRVQALSRADAVGAEELAWQGTLLIAEYEQQTVIQKHLGEIGPGLGFFLSAMAFIDFTLEDVGSWRAVLSPEGAAKVLARLHEHGIQASSFYLYLRDHGGALLEKTGGRPEFTNFDQRWLWIRDSVFPLWREVQRTHPDLRSTMDNLIERPVVFSRFLAGD